MTTPYPDMPRRAYWLPNTLTGLALAAGFFAIVAAIDGNFARAGIAVFIAGVFDSLDGRVARFTNTASAFGKEFDSLSDMVAFGLAPAVVVYQWGVERLTDYNLAWGRLGWLVTFAYVVAAAIRLARFNSIANARGEDDTPDRYFEGLPSPAAAALVAAFVWLSAAEGVAGFAGLAMAFVITAAAGALMISPVRYRSFKEFSAVGYAVAGFSALLAIWLVTFNPPAALFWVCATYAALGPLLAAIGLLRKRPSTTSGAEKGDDA
ncbi:MAG: CDP-diacylglycerol--serine O-phosphatidyltransferase [Pseudomonadota bacterium]